MFSGSTPALTDSEEKHYDKSTAVLSHRAAVWSSGWPYRVGVCPASLSDKWASEEVCSKMHRLLTFLPLTLKATRRKASHMVWISDKTQAVSVSISAICISFLHCPSETITPRSLTGQCITLLPKAGYLTNPHSELYRKTDVDNRILFETVNILCLNISFL